LISVALTYRPELAAQQALVQATLERLRHEKLRPLMPSVVLRGAATNPAGTLSSGVFGGGINSDMRNFAMRNDMDVQVLWEWQNLGFGNRARVRAERARNEAANVELYAVQDRVAAEVARAHAQVRSAATRAAIAEEGLRDALAAERLNFEGIGQTRGAGRQATLLIRPQEAVASVQALAQAYYDYYGAVADYDRSQFRLYRALGQPPQELFEPKPPVAAQAPCPQDVRNVPHPAPATNEPLGGHPR
jgi:outer membrane protein TolC